MNPALTFILHMIGAFGFLVFMTLIWLAGYKTGHSDGTAQGEDATWDHLGGPTLPPLEKPHSDLP